MKAVPVIIILLLISDLLVAQVNKEGDVALSFSIGPSLSNFQNSEAPHKMYLYQSDVTPAFFSPSDLTKVSAYSDYKTSVFKDILYGVSMHLHFEYFLKENLSIVSGISYQSKGISLNYSNTSIGRSTNRPTRILEENHKRKIANDYLIIPVSFQKYFLKEKNMFVLGGIYAGYLVSSRIDYLDKKDVRDEFMDGYQHSNYSFWIDNKKDTKKEFTNTIDFGFSFGTGYVKGISNKINFKTEMLFNLGVRKVDSKYDNEFSVSQIPKETGYTSIVRSTNYYGLNSNSKNMNMCFTVGLAYKLN